MARTGVVVRSYARKFEEERCEMREDCRSDLTASKRGSVMRK